MQGGCEPMGIEQCLTTLRWNDLLSSSTAQRTFTRWEQSEQGTTTVANGERE